MEEYVVVFRVSMMTVAVPLAGSDMDLDVSRYHLAIDNKNGIPKVATTGGASSTRIHYLKSLPRVGDQIGHQLVLPDTGNNLF